MLLELAIGDSYGAGFEYAHPDFVEKYNKVNCYLSHPKHKNKPGRYTDDTAMSLAISEALLEGNQGLTWTREHLANKFVEAFKRDPRKGYSSGFYALLCEVKDGEELLAKINSNSDRSGAAMRSPPIGILKDIAQIKEYCIVQGSITHNTEDGINASIASALMTHYFAYDIGKKKYLGSFLENNVKGNWSYVWDGPIGSKGWMSVIGAVTAITQNDNMTSVLKNCISFTGDVDTVASIAMAAASFSKEITNNLPKFLFEYLENDKYGRDYIVEIDKKLLARIK